MVSKTPSSSSMASSVSIPPKADSQQETEDKSDAAKKDAQVSIKRQASVLGQKISIHRRSVYTLLKDNADELRFYYSCIETRSTFGPRFSQATTKIWDGVRRLEPIADHVPAMAFQYDFDPRTPGNGLRSIIAVVDLNILHLLRLLKEIQEQRSDLLFRAHHYAKELEAFVNAFVVLVKAIERVYEYLPLWPADELFAENDLEQELHVMMGEIESLDHSPFFGRAMGFQFCASMANVFQVIGISLASYSLLWDVKRPSSTTLTGAASNLITSGQYVINPEERARRIHEVTMNADIEFCKAFWNLTEGPLLQELPRWFCPTLAVNEMWQIPGDLAFQLETIDGRMLEVPPPSAHTGTRNLPVRVLSYHLREGMPNQNASRIFKNTSNERSVLPKSPSLIFHVHGGGFVATSTKTHEPYLRHWAKSLNCPIVSVDYSLAPENPYPRAAEEVYYAYAWVLANAERLGWTGERICFAGDSAGGLLLASTTLRLIKRHIKRLPDGLALIYPAFLAQYSPSPSRLLSLLDPLLPMGIVARCLAAYTGNIEYLEPDNCPMPPKSNAHNNDKNAQAAKPPTPSREPQVGTAFGTDAAAAASMDETNVAGDFTFTPSNPSFDVASTSEEEEEKYDNGTVSLPISAKQAADVRHVFHKQLKRTNAGSSPGPRIRSQSDNALISPTNAVENMEVDDEDEFSSEGSESLSPVIAVTPKNPNQMVFSAANFGDSFLDYLRDNDLTKVSFRRFSGSSKSTRERANVIGGSEASAATSKDKDQETPAVENQENVGYGRSQSTGSLATITRASASIGHKMGLYVMDNLTGWFSPARSPNETGQLQGGAIGTHPTPQKPQITSPLAKFHNMPVPKDPFLSPLLAPDSWLARFPRTAILACHLDPLLDDSVSFAKRLKGADVNVTLDLIDSLPHGFLNFAMFNPECREAARLCCYRMREILKLTRD